MNIRMRTSYRKAVGLATLTWLSLVLSGCMDFYGSRERETRAAASRPYYGTGIVAKVGIRSKGIAFVVIDFGSFAVPPSYTKLLIVRSNSIVGKVQMGWGNRGAEILEGDPQIGDVTVGWQREAEFTSQQPSRKLP